MTKTFRTALYVTSALAFEVASLSANAQGYGPGGMMGDGNGWGMGYGWGMGGFGGIGMLVLVLGIVGIAVLALRRRNP